MLVYQKLVPVQNRGNCAILIEESRSYWGIQGHLPRRSALKDAREGRMAIGQRILEREEDGCLQATQWFINREQEPQLVETGVAPFMSLVLCRHTPAEDLTPSLSDQGLLLCLQNTSYFNDVQLTITRMLMEINELRVGMGEKIHAVPFIHMWESDGKMKQQ